MSELVLAEAREHGPKSRHGQWSWVKRGNTVLIEGNHYVPYYVPDYIPNYIPNYVPKMAWGTAVGKVSGNIIRET